MHHYYHNKNFTILHPMMDIICGTYLVPSESLLSRAKKNDTFESDVYNWKILLQTPYAKNISCIEYQLQFVTFLKNMRKDADTNTTTHINEIIKK